MSWYATRESVKRALDVKETARSDAQIDDALAGATEAADGECRRTFTPRLTTRKFDFPDTPQTSRTWKLWLGRNEIVAVTGLASGGRTIDPGQFIARRADDLDTPPFDCVEILLSGQATFGGGPTYQQDIQLTGWFGYGDTQQGAGALARGISSTDPVVQLDAVGASRTGVGDLLTIGDERLAVTGRGSVDSALTLAGDLAPLPNAAVVPFTGSGTLRPDEVITVDGERMLVLDVLGSSLLVRRAWDGTALAAHTSGATLYASRLMYVDRGQSGTTAAAHVLEDPVTRLQVPALVETWTRAHALSTLLNERAGYARASGSGESETELKGTQLRQLTAQLRQTYRRQAFTEAV